MKILGIDPGYERLGLAVVEQKAGRPNYIYSTCLRTPSGLDFTERLGQLGQELEKILAVHQPEVVAMEQVFFMAANRTTAFKTSEVKGMIRWLAARQGLKIIEFTPLQIKEALTGYGRAEKGQVALMVRRLLPGVPDRILDDELDAIAVAFLAANEAGRPIIHK
jgi:crossover junction endodeoxyribonuclease RuvC